MRDKQPSKRIEFDEEVGDDDYIEQPGELDEEALAPPEYRNQQRPQAQPTEKPVPQQRNNRRAMPTLPKTFTIKSIPVSIENKILNQKTNEELDLTTALITILNDLDYIKEKL